MTIDLWMQAAISERRLQFHCLRGALIPTTHVNALIVNIKSEACPVGCEFDLQQVFHLTGDRILTAGDLGDACYRLRGGRMATIETVAALTWVDLLAAITAWSPENNFVTRLTTLLWEQGSHVDVEGLEFLTRNASGQNFVSQCVALQLALNLPPNTKPTQG